MRKFFLPIIFFIVITIAGCVFSNKTNTKINKATNNEVNKTRNNEVGDLIKNEAVTENDVGYVYQNNIFTFALSKDLDSQDELKAIIKDQLFLTEANIAVDEFCDSDDTNETAKYLTELKKEKQFAVINLGDYTISLTRNYFHWSKDIAMKRLSPCIAGANEYPKLISSDYIIWTASCGSGADYSGLGRCEKIKDQVEKTLQLIN